MKHLTNDAKRWLIAIPCASAIFLSLAHHATNFWERSAAVLILLLAAGISVFTGGFFLLSRRISLRLSGISGRRIILLGLAALLIGSFITWQIYRVPSTNQTIAITPVLSGDQTLALLELKADGGVISLEQAALESGWEEAKGVLYANRSSRPLTITFPARVNSPISLLFVTSPQSGMVDIAFEREHVQADLSSATEGMDEILFSSTYRGLPGGIFIPILVGIDLLAFGVLLLFVLILQELGERSTSGSPEPAPRSRRFPLVFLIGLGTFLHALYALSSALAVGPDSAGYLEGAVHLARFGNLDGLPLFRGPGTTFLFGPVVWIFGRNPWGIKILLHLIALACIPVSYQIGWQLSRDQRVAFLSGLIAVLSPDLFYFANFVMADLPNLFFVLLFCWFLILGLETPRWHWILAVMLTASFASLLRSENSILIAIGFLALFASFTGKWRQGRLAHPVRLFIQLGVALVIAILPIFWWVNHNQRLYGFQASRAYIGHVIYDGWIYFGNTSKLPITDPNSEAVKKIDLAIQEYPITIGEVRGVPTGGEIYPSLIKSGYTPEQALALLEKATWDSIKSNRNVAFELLPLKIRAALRPKRPPNLTYRLPDEPIVTKPLKAEFFDTENLSIPPLIGLQRWANEMVGLFYLHIYRAWVVFCLLPLFLSLFRRPALTWTALVVIILTRILIPMILGVPGWRFTLAGWIPLQITAISWLFLLAAGIKASSRADDSQVLREAT